MTTSGIVTTTPVPSEQPDREALTKTIEFGLRCNWTRMKAPYRFRLWELFADRHVQTGRITADEVLHFHDMAAGLVERLGPHVTSGLLVDATKALEDAGLLYPMSWREAVAAGIATPEDVEYDAFCRDNPCYAGEPT